MELLWLTRNRIAGKNVGTQGKIVELVETILVYKFPTLSSKEISEMLQLSDLKHTRVYQEGKEEGREEGREQEGLKIVLSLLQYRLGSLDAGLKEQVERLSLEQVERLGQALLDFARPNDLVIWLQVNPPVE